MESQDREPELELYLSQPPNRDEGRPSEQRKQPRIE
jgi:hypothetical protein